MRTGLAIVLGLLVGACGDFEVRLPDASKLAQEQKDYATYARLVQEGHDAWAGRHKDPARTDHFKKAVSAWERAYAIDPSDRSVLSNLTVACYYVATYDAKESEEKLAFYQKGYEYGLAAVLLNPAIKQAFDATPQEVHLAIAQHLRVGEIPAAYWMTTCWARILEEGSLAQRAVNAPKLKAIMEAIYGIGRTYHSGAVHRFFGAFFCKAPAQRDPATQSKDHFQRAIDEWPLYLENRVFMAEYYCVFANDEELFVKLLTEVIESDPAKDPQGYRFDNHNARTRAKALLEQRLDLF